MEEVAASTGCRNVLVVTGSAAEEVAEFVDVNGSRHLRAWCGALYYAICRPPNPGGDGYPPLPESEPRWLIWGRLPLQSAGRGTRWKEPTTTYWRSDACS
jgi:hypothetical protein